MELNRPVNYLPQGRANIVQGFGYVTNKNEFQWLQDHSISQNRYEELIGRLDRASAGHLKEQKKMRIKQNEIFNENERLLSSRTVSVFREDGYTDECAYTRIIRMKL